MKINILKEWMLHDLFKSINSKSLYWIFMQKLTNEVLTIITHRHILREVQALSHYSSKHLFLIIFKEGCLADYHFIGKRTKSPPIYWEWVTCFRQNFRCHIFWCSSYWESFLMLLHLFRDAKINQRDIAYQF